jgi:rod shape-determining protein MreD
MKDFIRVSIGVIIAFVIYTLFNKISASLLQLFNVFSLVVIYFAVEKDEIFGACLGGFCGLIHDSFSLGVFGVAGLAKTITGFLAGYISKKIDVLPVVRSFIFIFIIISIEFILWALFYSLIFSQSITGGRKLIYFQPLSTALVGSLLFLLLRRIKKE